jgi:hypothetical protein
VSDRRGYLVVPIAIREDDVVRLHFPSDITPEEAEKVARVIRAYAVEGDNPAERPAEQASPESYPASPNPSPEGTDNVR